MALDLSPTAPTDTNAAGGRQSKLEARCDLLPPKALLRVAEVLYAGAKKYGEHNWEKIRPAEHVNHAMTHVLAWLAGDRQDDHLSHAACRMLMALDLTIPPRKTDATG